jgi:two-component system, NtrC family, sensor kinase
VIAIENARLLSELQERNEALTQAHAKVTEALEQQAATSKILRVISSSPTDVQPVFDSIGESARQLCDADLSTVARFDGELIHLVAHHGVTGEAMETVRRLYPHSLSFETMTTRAVRDRVIVHVPDVLVDPRYEAKDTALAVRYRGCLAVPMLREGEVIGAIFVARATAGYFADAQVALLQTFADQAVIAIENVRLFNELQSRTAELTRSVGELRALGDVSQALSSTQDVDAVLDTIVTRQ